MRGQQQQCWKMCENGSNIDPTLFQHRRSWNKRNIGTGSCWLKSLTGFKLCGTTPNNTQQHTTTFNIVCIRTQHVTSNNAGSCWPAMFRPFARGFNVLVAEDVSILFRFRVPRARANQRTQGVMGSCKQRALGKDKFPIFVPFEKLTALRLCMLMNYSFL